MTAANPTIFPGSIHDGEGKNLCGTAPDLEQEQIDAYPHRSMVSDRDMPTIAWVWLLNDDAEAQAIPPSIMSEAVQLVLAGKAVLMLAKRQVVEVDVRDGLMQALDLFTALPETGGRA